MIFIDMLFLMVGLAIGGAAYFTQEPKPAPAMACCFQDSTDPACVQGREFLKSQAAADAEQPTAPLSPESH